MLMERLNHHHELNPTWSNLTALYPCPTGEGQLQCGMPYEGQGVLGCWKGNGSDGTKEWAGIQMLAPMIPGECYKVSFWIQNKKDNPDFLAVTNQWGLFFSKTPSPDFDPNTLNFSTVADQWVATEEVIEGSEWIYKEFIYEASDSYRYAYIGYMGNLNTSTYTVWSDSPSIGFYVWLDEIIVERLVPELTVSPDPTICQGESVTLSASSNFPISWENGASSDTVFQVSPTETTTYYVEAGPTASCTVTKAITVNVVSEPTVSFVVEGASCDTLANGAIDLSRTGNGSTL